MICFRIFRGFCSIKIQRHNLQSQRLFHRLLSLIRIRRLQNLTHPRSLPLLFVASSPMISCRHIGFPHFQLEFLLVEASRKRIAELIFQIAIYNHDFDKREIDGEILVKIREVDDCLDETFEDGFDDFLAKVASLGNWNWVAENHSEAFLENGVLGFGLRNLFLPVVSVESRLKDIIRDETWSILRMGGNTLLNGHVFFLVVDRPILCLCRN